MKMAATMPKKNRNLKFQSHEYDAEMYLNTKPSMLVMKVFVRAYTQIVQEMMSTNKSHPATDCCPFPGGLAGSTTNSFDTSGPYEHPVVLPHVSHFMQVPFRTSVKLPHSPHISPS